MTNRLTLVNQRLDVTEPLRNNDFEMRSSGLRYNLLLPFAPLVLYGAMIWSARVILYNCGTILRRFR
jgi:hypothetical protein